MPPTITSEFEGPKDGTKIIDILPRVNGELFLEDDYYAFLLERYGASELFVTLSETADELQKAKLGTDLLHAGDQASMSVYDVKAFMYGALIGLRVSELTSTEEVFNEISNRFDDIAYDALRGSDLYPQSDRDMAFMNSLLGSAVEPTEELLKYKYLLNHPKVISAFDDTYKFEAEDGLGLILNARNKAVALSAAFDS